MYRKQERVGKVEGGRGRRGREADCLLSGSSAHAERRISELHQLYCLMEIKDGRTGKGQSESFDQYVQILRRIMFQLEQIHTAVYFERFNNAERYQRSEALSVGRTLSISSRSRIQNIPGYYHLTIEHEDKHHTLKTMQQDGRADSPPTATHPYRPPRRL